MVWGREREKEGNREKEGKRENEGNREKEGKREEERERKKIWDECYGEKGRRAGERGGKLSEGGEGKEKVR